MADDKPPLDLEVELVYPDGSTVRWDSQSAAQDRPTGIGFRTARFDGFADGALTLNRRIDLDYPDLALLDGVNLIGYDGSVAYEGRIGATPRSLAAGQGHQVSLTLQGWMSSAKDRPFVEVYVDRDLSKWSDMSRTRRLSVLGSNYGKLASPSSLADSTGTPVVETGISDSWASPFVPLAEAWWLPQPGISLSQIYYALSSNSTAPWIATATICADDTGASPTTTANLIGAASGYLAASGAAAFLQFGYPTSPAGTDGAFYYAHWSNLAVYGNHAVPLRGPDPGGVFASDVIADLITRFCPKLNVTGLITPTTYPIPHLSFTDETMPYDAMLSCNAFHRWGLEVYENRAPRYAPVDLTDYDWEVRLDDPGTTVQLQGDDLTMLANGVVVRYTDLNTGRETRLSPAVFPDLADASSDNPANRAGIRLWAQLSLSSPTTMSAALQIGRAYLAEFLQVQAPGSITITGHIRDRAGHWQQGWKVRAGDRVAVTDLPNDRPRLITETSWNHDAKTLTISVESSEKKLDAVLDRIQVALQAANLSLPA